MKSKGNEILEYLHDAKLASVDSGFPNHAELQNLLVENSMQVRQPYFEGRTYRISGELTNTDNIMNNTLWIGVYPGLNEEMLSFVVEKIEAFFGVNF